jgi:hypothetical protein
MNIWCTSGASLLTLYTRAFELRKLVMSFVNSVA